MCDLLWQNAPRMLQLCLHRRLTPRCAKGSCVTKNKPGAIHQPRPEEPAKRASRRTATGEIVPAAILRDAVLRTAPQDEVRGM